MNRRSFLARLGTNAILIGIGARSLSGCSSNSGSDGGGGSSGSGGASEGVTDGTCSTGAGVAEPDPIHTHDGVPLSAAEVADLTPRSILLLSGDHQHWYNFTAQDFMDLQNGQTVTKDLADLDLINSDEEHDHILYITC